MWSVAPAAAAEVKFQSKKPDKSVDRRAIRDLALLLT